MTARLSLDQMYRLIALASNTDRASSQMALASDAYQAALAVTTDGPACDLKIAGIPVVLDATMPPGEVRLVSVVRMNLGALDEAQPAPPSVAADPMASAAADSADWRDTVRRRARRTDPPRGHVGGPAR